MYREVARLTRNYQTGLALYAGQGVDMCSALSVDDMDVVLTFWSLWAYKICWREGTNKMLKVFRAAARVNTWP